MTKQSTTTIAISFVIAILALALTGRAQRGSAPVSGGTTVEMRVAPSIRL
jgi:hypothetical protein